MVTRNMAMTVILACGLWLGATYARAQSAPAKTASSFPTEQVVQEEKAEHIGGLWQVITRAGWFGILIWIFLLACSIATVALVIDSFMTIRELRVSPPQLVMDVRTAIDEGDLVKAIDQCTTVPSPLANILTAGFENVEEGYEALQDAVGVAADQEAEKMLQRVTYLSVISNTTPMLGLIGTVQGMIYAFKNLGTMQAGAAQQSMLAINISHGLWATAVGLGISVPAAMLYFFFKNKATRLILNMEAMTLNVTKVLRHVEVMKE